MTKETILKILVLAVLLFSAGVILELILSSIRPLINSGEWDETSRRTLTAQGERIVIRAGQCFNINLEEKGTIMLVRLNGRENQTFVFDENGFQVGEGREKDRYINYMDIWGGGQNIGKTYKIRIYDCQKEKN